MASLAPYFITLGATDYPVKYAGLLAYIEPYLTNLETFSFSGGNVGLGVTPSAWGAGFKAAQLDSQSAITGSGANTYLSTNWFYTTSDRYIANGFATLYRQNAGQHIFYTAPSGTAGNAISFTQAMTLDASGKLALGWPEARADFDVGTNTATAITKSIHLGFSDDDFYGFRIANANTASVTYAGTLAFQRGTGAAWADVVTITDGGNLLVNTSTIAGAGGYTFQVQAGGIAAINNNNSASTGYVFSSYRRGGTEIGSVTQNGTTAVLFNTTSDRRLKDNIVPAPSASNVIDAIEIVSHDWKSAPDEHVTFGVIAQDLALVAPQAVMQGDDGDEIEKTWGVDYSKLVPMLIKEIQSLRARVAQLESKA